MNGANMETAISWTLRVGVIASAAVLVIGILLAYASASSYQLGYELMILGIFILFSTPIARVLLSIFSFAMERNYIYVAITVVVFIDIMFAIFVVPMLIHA
ncbi:MAG: DUF1634 domain-containing protein [Candidatus Marsarchaeota archaeon]|jgi:uncharacterized membrane protein|nr:DUF1634 domain-containing protein [Candidatus Marsarchaeota archaeon]MCL5111450.1 DUF1634 domain-containing protein [Candidatus Marsarchaeota archaeon]